MVQVENLVARIRLKLCHIYIYIYNILTINNLSRGKGRLTAEGQFFCVNTMTLRLKHPKKSTITYN